MKPSVFISYSHRDEVWKDRLVAQLDAVNNEAGRVEIWHDRRIRPGSEWFTEIQAAMDAAVVAVCLVSPHYLQSTFCTEYEVGPLLERRERSGLVVLPVLVAPCSWQSVHWLKPIQMLPRDGRTVLDDFRGREDEVFRAIAAQIVDLLDDPGRQPSNAPPVVEPPEDVDLTRLAYTGLELVGREAELARLNLAWRNHDTHLINLSGWGGVGKTTLVNKWLEGVETGQFKGARKLFAWTFTDDFGRRQESGTEPFMQVALEWFGDPRPSRGSPWGRAERLGRLIAEDRALLVLDGIDAFQSMLATTPGHVTDPALSTLLFELATRNPGLCVVTSRSPLNELRSLAHTVAFERLERLSPAAGRALLRLAGVRGLPESSLEQASRILNGHALALRLFAAWLTELPGQLESRLDRLLQTASIAAGEETPLLLRWLVDEHGDPATVELLSFLGVLDGVAEGEALEWLRAEPAVPGTNEHIGAMNERDWQRLVVDLRRRGLLMPGDGREPERLATHPLIAEHFAERLRALAPEAWATSHRRLSRRYGEQTVSEPETLVQAWPALRAVYHGARAGDLSSALELFWSRVDQGDRHRATEINAPGSVLSALQAFYAAGGWSPQAGLNPGDEAYLINSTGAMLRALGRLDDAMALFDRALQGRKAQGDAANASKNAVLVAELALVTGRLDVALSAAEQAVELATQAGSPGQLVYCWSGYADILHHQGERQAALAAFERAEHIHRTVLVPRGFPIEVLYRWPGVRYAELLLTLGRSQEVLRRASVLSATGPDISREETACGMAVCAEALRLDDGASAFLVSTEGRRNAIGYADQALEMLRGSNVEMYLPRLLTVRARNLMAVHDLDAASRDLERALRVARRNQAVLFTLDTRIEQARIDFARGNRDLAAKTVEASRTEAEKIGYGRAIGQLLEIERSLGKS